MTTETSEVTTVRVPPDRRDRALIEAVAVLLAADRTPDELYEALCQMLPRFVDAQVAFIALRDAGEVRLRYVYDHGAGQPADRTLPHRSRCWDVLRSGRTQVFRRREDWIDVERYPVDPERPDLDDSVSAVFIPLTAAGDRLGVLSVQTPTSDAYGEAEIVQLEAIARYLAIAVRNQRLFARLRRMVDRDPLTGLANHSTVLRAIDHRMAEVSDERVGVVMLDITGFGMINDVHGARAGDRVLATIADRLASFEDDATTVGRFGGDDFVIVATRRDRGSVGALVDAVSSAVQGLTLNRADITVPISINIGWATAPDESATRSSLLALADLRLRLSLQRGGTPVGGSIAEIVRYGDVRGIEPLVDSALLRDPYTRTHLVHVNHMAHRWAELLDLNAVDADRLRVGALVHDLGKLLIPDPILLKPARLTPGEYAAMQKHAEYGEFLLGGYEGFEAVAKIVGQHHERIDGAGYPRGRRGDDIDPLARAIAIIDAYSAMVLDRPYHRAIEESDALLELERCAGTQFDAALVQSFVTMHRDGRLGGSV